MTCGGGRQFRSRGKQVEKYGGAPCEGSPEQGRDCNTQFCPSQLSIFTLCMGTIIVVVLNLVGNYFWPLACA